MKKTGPKNRGSHPDGLPLTRSGLYISCAYLLEAFRNSVARSRCFPAVRQQIFRSEHMAERDLLFHDTVAPHLAAYAPEASAAQQRDTLTHHWESMNYEGRMMKWDSGSGAFSSFIIHPSTLGSAPSHPIRNRLLRLTADSPDLLAIIKQEGKV